MTCCLSGEVTRNHYTNELAPCHLQVQLPPPLATAASTDMMWNSGCDDSVMTSCQLPQHCLYRLLSWPTQVTADHNASCRILRRKTSVCRRNRERHRDRVILYSWYGLLFTTNMHV